MVERRLRIGPGKLFTEFVHHGAFTQPPQQSRVRLAATNAGGRTVPVLKGLQGCRVMLDQRLLTLVYGWTVMTGGHRWQCGDAPSDQHRRTHHPASGSQPQTVDQAGRPHGRIDPRRLASAILQTGRALLSAVRGSSRGALPRTLPACAAGKVPAIDQPTRRRLGFGFHRCPTLTLDLPASAPHASDRSRCRAECPGLVGNDSSTCRSPVRREKPRRRRPRQS